MAGTLSMFYRWTNASKPIDQNDSESVSIKPRRRFPVGKVSAYAFLAIFVLATRMDSLVTDVKSWDEATFMLMSQDILRGHLPYVYEFDNKPPGLFFTVALFQFAFGQSLLVVRLVSAFFVYIAALFCFEISRSLTGPRRAFLASTFVVSVNSLSFGAITQSEQIAAAFMMASLLLILNKKDGLSHCVAGICMAVAVLTRSNLVIAAVCLVVTLSIFALYRRSTKDLIRVTLYGIGGLVPLIILIGVYYAAGDLAYLQLAMIDVPANYASERGPLALLITNAHQFALAVESAPFVLLPFAGLSAIGTWVVVRLGLFTGSPRDLKFKIAAIMTLLSATFLSIILGGAFYPHYWLQLLPLLAIIISFALPPIELHRKTFWIGAILVLIPILSALSGHAEASVSTVARLGYYQRNYPLRRAAHLIGCAKKDADRVWALQGHLVYWYLNERPISPAATHPTNLVRPSIIDTLEHRGYVPPDELGRVFRSKPTFLIQAAANVPFYFKDPGRRYVDWRDKNYHLWKDDPDFKIFVINGWRKSKQSSGEARSCVGAD